MKLSPIPILLFSIAAHAAPLSPVEERIDLSSLRKTMVRTAVYLYRLTR